MPKPRKVVGPSGRLINVGGPTWVKLSETQQKKALEGKFAKVVPNKSPPKKKTTSDSKENFVYVLLVKGVSHDNNLIVFKDIATVKKYVQDPRRGKFPDASFEKELKKFSPRTHNIELGSGGYYILYRSPIIDHYPNFNHIDPHTAVPYIKIL